MKNSLQRDSGKGSGIVTKTACSLPAPLRIEVDWSGLEFCFFWIHCSVNSASENSMPVVGVFSVSRICHVEAFFLFHLAVFCRDFYVSDPCWKNPFFRVSKHWCRWFRVEAFCFRPDGNEKMDKFLAKMFCFCFCVVFHFLQYHAPKMWDVWDKNSACLWDFVAMCGFKTWSEGQRDPNCLPVSPITF